MIEVEAVTVEDERILWMRERLDFLQSKMEVLGPLLGKGYIRKHLKTWRHVITVAVKDMPKIGELHSFMNQPSLKVGDLVKNIEFPSSYKETSIKQLKYVLEFPDRFKASAKDRKNENPVHIDIFRAQLLKERQLEAGVPNPLTQPQVEIKENKVKKAYKKYVKEWKEEHD